MPDSVIEGAAGTSKMSLQSVGTPQSQAADYKWSNNATKLLLDLYGQYRRKVGTMEMKTLKQMWQKIAEDLHAILGVAITASNCENRWKVLERNYKKHVDDQNSTGRGRKVFEYAEEMETICGKRRAIHPQLLLSNNFAPPPLSTPNQENTQQRPNHESEDEESAEELQDDAFQPTKRTTRKRISILEQIRLDRKIYQEQRLEIERAKLEQLVRRNNLIEERNRILQKNGIHTDG